MMIFLLRYRYKHGKNPHVDSKIYSLMAFITMLGAIAETGGFLVDGCTIACGRFLNYLFKQPLVPRNGQHRLSLVYVC